MRHTGDLFRACYSAVLAAGVMAGTASEARAQLAQMVKDINTTPFAADSDPDQYVPIGGVVYFAAYDVSNGRELWRTDGTAEGTRLVKDILPGATAPEEVSAITNVNGTLFFSSFTRSAGRELWKSDGTAAGTVMVKDLVPGFAGSDPYGLTNVNGTLFFFTCGADCELRRGPVRQPDDDAPRW